MDRIPTIGANRGAIGDSGFSPEKEKQLQQDAAEIQLSKEAAISWERSGLCSKEAGDSDKSKEGYRLAAQYYERCAQLTEGFISASKEKNGGEG